MAESPVVMKELLSKGAAFTSSYEEELAAAMMALKWIEEQDLDSECTVVLATDSQSLCTALMGTSDNIDPLIGSLGNLSCKLVVQWIPGHSNVL